MHSSRVSRFVDMGAAQARNAPQHEPSVEDQDRFDDKRHCYIEFKEELYVNVHVRILALAAQIVVVLLHCLNAALVEHELEDDRMDDQAVDEAPVVAEVVAAVKRYDENRVCMHR